MLISFFENVGVSEKWNLRFFFYSTNEVGVLCLLCFSSVTYWILIHTHLYYLRSLLAKWRDCSSVEIIKNCLLAACITAFVGQWGELCIMLLCAGGEDVECMAWNEFLITKDEAKTMPVIPPDQPREQNPPKLQSLPGQAILSQPKEQNPPGDS